MSELSDYISDLLKKGYDANQIRASLASYGYTPDQVNQAFSELSGGQNKGLSINPLYIVGGVFGLLMIILLVVLMLPEEEEVPVVVAPPPAPRFEIEMSAGRITPGSTLRFDLDVNSPKTQRVEIIYEVTPFEGTEVLVTRSDSGVFDGNKVVSKTLATPDLEEGEYLLTVIFDAEGGQRKKTRRFTVGYAQQGVDVQGTEGETENEEEPDQVDETEDESTEFEQEEEIYYPPPIDESTEGESVNLNEIVELSKQDPEKAEQMCRGISNTADKETCFSRVAESTGNKYFCEQIQTPFNRDGCYANFALKGDFSVCEDIYDEYQKNICNALAASQSQSQEQ